MNKVQKSYSFIVPMLNFSAADIRANGFINSYLGDRFYTGTTEWGESLFLHFDPTQLSTEFEGKLLASGQFAGTYTSPDGNKVFVYNLTEDQKTKIVSPFLEGKYSEIDRTYVNKFFPATVWTATGQIVPSNNYRILTKDSSLKEYWENILGLSLPDDAEVWSRPEAKDEIYYYA